MRCLVLGATGMLGQALMAEGERRGYEMVGAARSGAMLAIDITDEQMLREGLQFAAPDVVINAAAMASIDACEKDPERALRVNAAAVEQLAGLSPYLVQISTDQTGHSVYARTKAMGDHFAIDAGCLVVPTNIVGLRGHGQPTFLEWALDVIEHDRPATLYWDYVTSSIDVWHFAESLFDLLPARPSGRVTLAARVGASKANFVRSLAARLGRPLTQAVNASMPDPLRRKDLTLDVGAAEEALGYRLPTTDEVIDRIIEKLEDSQKWKHLLSPSVGV